MTMRCCIRLRRRGWHARRRTRRCFFRWKTSCGPSICGDAGLTALPGTLAGYVQREVLPTLARQKAGGAIAVKFEMAYLRDFAVGDPAGGGGRGGLRAVAGGLRSRRRADARLLSDYLFRRIALEAGRLGMAVHLHGLAGAVVLLFRGGGEPAAAGAGVQRPAAAGARTLCCCMADGRTSGRLGRCCRSRMCTWTSARSLCCFRRERWRDFCGSGWRRTRIRCCSGRMDIRIRTRWGGRNRRGWRRRMRVGGLALALSGMLADGELDRARAHALADGVLRAGNAAEALWVLRGGS